MGVTVTGRHQQAVASAVNQEGQVPSGRSEAIKTQGWALKSVKKPTRMTEKAKAYLEDIFQHGSHSGHKADPVEVSRQMKLEKDSDGRLFFKPDEWRTPQQISQLFSCLAAVQKQVDEDEIAAEESEVAMITLRNQVMQQVASPEHPIVVGNRNVCQLVHGTKLGSLKIAELQSICNHLDIEPLGSLMRKKSFTAPIESYVKLCSCFQD